MSSYTVESVLFSLQSDPGFMERFKSDPEAAIRDYPLTEKERRDILNWNVRAMSEAGVSDMLLMVSFSAIHGQQAMPDYMRRMNMPAGA
ncbi:MAG: hypothetical protein PHE36_03310 [Novosphingobium sp.]|nr:hypothetical protein [Novosphingobium sp.]